MKASDYDNGRVRMSNPYYLKDTEGYYYNQYPEFQVWEEGKQAGIKDVVEWVNSNSTKAIDMGATFRSKWLSQLKEWGIK